MMTRGPYPILLMLAMSMPGAVRALGLGDIRVDSALNEPLSAQIDIVGATRDELAALTARVANLEVFQHYGADRPSFLATATFKVGMDAQGRPVLNVRSADSFTDPLVSLLVDLRWGKNEIVREYSLLLDPPSYKVAPYQTASNRAAPATSEVGLASARPAARSQFTDPAPAPIIGDASATDPTRVRVAAGDTLRGVARRAGAHTETQAQTLMIAIFRANPGAFDGNINRMHRGAVLTIPTSTDVAAIPSADARREVRAHMTAWRLDGRPGAVPRVASAADAPAADKDIAAPDASLNSRVLSLEQQLEDLHKQLANEGARIQSLGQAKLAEAGTAQTAPLTPAPAVPQPAAPAPRISQQAAPNVPAPAATQAAALVQAPIVASANAAETPVDMAASRTPMTNAELFGPVAATLGLLVAGFAYVRRRLQNAPKPGSVAAPLPEPRDTGPEADLQAAVPAAMPTAELLSPIDSFKPAVSAAAEFPRRPHAVTADTAAKSLPPTGSATTSRLEVDTEALEQAYFESMPREFLATQDGYTVLADTDTVETPPIMHDLDTVLMDAKDMQTAPKNTPNPTKLDFNLTALDATPQHVQMPSGLNDRPAFKERRTNIVDVLKTAIERDPDRHDLRMKLLETYYSLAATNQRAFMEVVRTLSRQKDLLTADDWKKVTMMGREIAGDDGLFAELDPPKDGEDLADCA